MTESNSPSSDDNGQEPRLPPSAAMLPVLTGLTEALTRWKTGDRRIPMLYDFDDVPFYEFGRHLARLPLELEGWTLGEVVPIGGGVAGERDILQRLSGEMNLMSSEDLAERFTDALEGSRLAASFKRIQEAATLAELLRDDSTLGWSGFSGKRVNPEKEAEIIRQRMFADRYRGVFNWTMLRGWDAAQGAALIVEAEKGEMIDKPTASRFLTRAAGEMMVRFSSWHEFARSLLFARVYQALATSETYAEDILAADQTLLEELLDGPWAQFAWPRIRK